MRAETPAPRGRAPSFILGFTLVRLPPEGGQEEGAGLPRGLTWFAHGELHRAPGVEQLLNQRLGQHGGREEDGPAALAVEGAYQAVGDQAEVLAQLALWVQLWEGASKGWLWLGRGTRGPSWPHRACSPVESCVL